MAALKHRSKTPWLLIALTCCSFYTNCSVNHFESIHTSLQSAAGGGNGQGVDGKPRGTFDLPGDSFTCAGQPALVASISIKQVIELTLNSKDQCAHLIQGLEPSAVQSSLSDPTVISYRENLFTLRGADDVPDLETTVQAWCHTDATPQYDVVIRRSKGLLSATISSLNGENVRPFAVQGLVTSLSTEYTAEAFNLKIVTAPVAAASPQTWGPYQGALSAKTDRSTVSAPLSCRLATKATIGNQPETLQVRKVIGAPAHLAQQTLSAIGTQALVWGDDGNVGATPSTAAIYDPPSDSWTSVLGLPGRTSAFNQSLVWTGSDFILWGNDPAYAAASGIYNPATRSWKPISTLNAPSPRTGHGAVWNGSQMIVWGGLASGSAAPLTDGALYDPLTDRWTAMSNLNAPTARTHMQTQLIGQKMLIWAGATDDGQWNPVNTGAIYDPVADQWTTISTLNAPSSRINPITGWTGKKWIVWGGNQFGLGGGLFADGAVYNPEANTWTTISPVGAPANSPSALIPTGVWADDRLLVLSLDQSGNGRQIFSYDLILDRWSASQVVSGVTMDTYPMSVWTGSQMMIWATKGAATLPLLYTPFK